MDLFTGGAIAGLIAGLWSKIKLFASKLNSLFIISVHINNSQLSQAITCYLFSEFTCSRVSKKVIGGRVDFIRPLKKNRLIGCEELNGEPTIWWRKGRPLLVSKPSTDSAYVNFYYIRGTFNYKDLVESAIVAHARLSDLTGEENENTGDRFYIIKERGRLGEISGGGERANRESQAPDRENIKDTRLTKYDSLPIKWTREEIGTVFSSNALDKMALSREIEEAVMEAKRWKVEKDWFQDRGIPWKRGWLLVGSPGTGKTSFVRALAQDLNFPILRFDLSTMTNSDFMRAWERGINISPAIFLIEDIDNIFKGRVNICSTDMVRGISYDLFLNTLDGIEDTDGVFIIITTNDMASIDPALGCVVDSKSTRPGRIDRIITFSILDFDGRMKIASRIFRGIDQSIWINVVDEGEGDTGAQFQERCMKRALSLWNNKISYPKLASLSNTNSE